MVMCKKKAGDTYPMDKNYISKLWSHFFNERKQTTQITPRVGQFEYS